LIIKFVSDEAYWASLVCFARQFVQSHCEKWALERKSQCDIQHLLPELLLCLCKVYLRNEVDSVTLLEAAIYFNFSWKNVID
jgi:hypothetical protein